MTRNELSEIANNPVLRSRNYLAKNGKDCCEKEEYAEDDEHGIVIRAVCHDNVLSHFGFSLIELV
jgi:hypothetical protein